MKPCLILLVLSFFSCTSKDDSNTKRDSALNSELVTDDKREADTLQKTEPKIEVDSIELERFWNQAVIPILKKDKHTVLNNMDFPVLGHWTRMMDMDKDPEDATREDFEKVYDRFFCSDFIEVASKESKPGIYTLKDRVWFGFTVQDADGMSTVLLLFAKFDESYKLKEVHGFGGDFYETR